MIRKVVQEKKLVTQTRNTNECDNKNTYLTTLGSNLYILKRFSGVYIWMKLCFVEGYLEGGQTMQEAIEKVQDEKAADVYEFESIHDLNDWLTEHLA